MQKHARQLLVILLAAIAQSSAHAQPSHTQPKGLKAALLPAVKDGGFAMDGYFVWCSSVIKAGDTYHLFASRWPAEHGMAGWGPHSEVVRASSKALLGPYSFDEVVLQKREGKWDRTRIHNPRIVKAGEKFVLFYVNTANQTGYATADAIEGPWKRIDKHVMNAANPAPLIRPDGSLYMMARIKDDDNVNRAIAYTAPSYQGPYTLIEDGANLLPNKAELEDPFVWFANNRYTMILNDWKGIATGTNKAGAEYWSKDGAKWFLLAKDPVFTKLVAYDDDTKETFTRRERPYVYVNEDGEAEALFTACLPKDGPARIVVQPVKKYVPGR